MQAIITRYLPPTQTKPARIKVFCSRDSITVTEDCSHEHAHIMAAKILINKFRIEDDNAANKTNSSKWSLTFVTGSMPSGDYCHLQF
jgi:hypothetical protein